MHGGSYRVIGMLTAMEMQPQHDLDGPLQRALHLWYHGMTHMTRAVCVRQPAWDLEARHDGLPALLLGTRRVPTQIQPTMAHA